MDGLLEALSLDKKAIASGLRLVLLRSIGNAVVDDESTLEEIIRILQLSLGHQRTSAKE